MDHVREFIKHPTFQELPLAVHTAVEEYLHKNPGTVLPATWNRLTGLRAFIHDYLHQPDVWQVSIHFSARFWSLADPFILPLIQ